MNQVIRTPAAIGKVKTRADTSSGLSLRTALLLDKYPQSLEGRSQVRRVQPFLTDAHEAKRKTFANWICNNFRKERTMRILEKHFNVDRVYNLQNDRIW